MALTLLQIVDAALDQAGLDSGYRAKARNWLNIILAKQASDFKWPHWHKQTSATALTPGTTAYSLPADFNRADTAYLYKLVNGVYTRGNQIRIYDSYRFDGVDYTSLTGVPNAAWIDTLNSQIVFNSAPSDSTNYYKLRYYKDAPSYSTSGADDSSTPDFPDQNFLIQELTKWCYEYQDDERFPQKAGESDQALKITKRNIYENDATPQMPLEQFHFQPRRRR